jgi:protein dithiol oxidoreductase (disulfide-forming)
MTSKLFAMHVALVSARRFLLIAGLLAVGLPAFSQEPRARAGLDYRQIEAQPVASSERIEVIEFFWYGCPYCFRLQQPLEHWLARKPADVELRRIPAIFRESWVPHARLYYTLDALGETDRLHSQVYESFHIDRENLNTAHGTAQWAARHGIDRERWLNAYRSEEVERAIEASRESTRRYAIRGTPSLVVDGRYLTSSGMTETVAGVIPILEDLILIARDRRLAR